MTYLGPYKGYTARVQWEVDDELYVGRVSGIRHGINFHGHTTEELPQSFRDAVDGYIEGCVEFGIEPQVPEQPKLHTHT